MEREFLRIRYFSPTQEMEFHVEGIYFLTVFLLSSCGKDQRPGVPSLSDTPSEESDGRLPVLPGGQTPGDDSVSAIGPDVEYQFLNASVFADGAQHLSEQGDFHS